MHSHNLAPWKHDHTFGQDAVRPGERRTLVVVLITATAMVVEIAAGLAFGSMALLADGIHMASHAMALAIALFAYVFARRFAGDGRFSFGTGKVNAMGGFVGAILLVVFAAGMAHESFHRIAEPVNIQFDQAIAVAVLGLVVNVVCAFILGGGHSHSDGGHHHHHHGHGKDHNLRAAYLHVVVDALTSVLAIVALVAGKFAGAAWLDPAMGVVGAVLITRWSWGLLKDCGKTLMAFEAAEPQRSALRDALEREGDRVADLYVWSIGPGFYAAAVSLVTDRLQTAAAYHDRVPSQAHAAGRGARSEALQSRSNRPCARVEPEREEVNAKVDDDEQHREEVDDRLDHRIVARIHRDRRVRTPAKAPATPKRTG